MRSRSDADIDPVFLVIFLAIIIWQFFGIICVRLFFKLSCIKRNLETAL